jgi:membrane protein
MLIAAGVTYYGLLALFPAIAALVSLFGLFADPETIKQQLSNLQGVLPEGAIQIIGDQISRIQAQGGRTLGVYFFTGLAISLWSANAGIKSIFDALNAVYREPERRSFLQYNLQALMFTLGGILFVILSVASIVVLPAVFAFVGLESITGWVVSLSRWPLLLLVTLVALALLYRYGPSRERAAWQWVTWGSGIAAVVWLAVSMLYSWYVANFGTFNQTYGSLGAAIGFMIWMWLSTIVVLLGAEINGQLEHQTRKDTTAGEPRPLGQRGAHYADKVASA